MIRGVLPMVLLACADPVHFDAPIPVDGTFARTPATGEELDRYQEAAAYSERHDGRALLVLKGDTVVFETGQNGHPLEAPHHLFSGTKSFTCALFAVLEADGVLSADERVRDTLPELPDAAAELTVDQLLHLTSGATQDFRALTWDGLRGHRRVEDTYAHAVGLPFDAVPGERFRYGATDFNLFGELVTRKTGRSPRAILEERVFAPLGLETAGWLEDPMGNPALAHGVWTTAAEWATYGALVRDDGVFLGERILPEGALHDCLVGSDANPGYGRTFWLNADVPDGVEKVAQRRLEPDGPQIWNEGPADLVAAAGHDDQRLYIVPSEDLVVVRLGEGGWGFRDRELLARLLGPR